MAFLHIQNLNAVIKVYGGRSGNKPSPYDSSSDPSFMLWNRTTGNTLEQAVPFLTSFWLSLATCTGDVKPLIVKGFVYVAFRAIYPLVWWLGRSGPSGPGPLVRLSTIPGYYLVYSFLYAAYTANSKSA